MQQTIFHSQVLYSTRIDLGPCRVLLKIEYSWFLKVVSCDRAYVTKSRWESVLLKASHLSPPPPPTDAASRGWAGQARSYEGRGGSGGRGVGGLRDQLAPGSAWEHGCHPKNSMLYYVQCYCKCMISGGQEKHVINTYIVIRVPLYACTYNPGEVCSSRMMHHVLSPCGGAIGRRWHSQPYSTFTHCPVTHCLLRARPPASSCTLTSHFFPELVPRPRPHPRAAHHPAQPSRLVRADASIFLPPPPVPPPVVFPTRTSSAS